MTAGSVIGSGAVVRGNVRGAGSLEILGRVEGDVNVDGDVVLGESGVVRGNVTGAELSVAGTVQGDLRGTVSLLLERGARVVGDLSAPRIGVAPGALVRGTVRTDGEPALAGAVRRGATVVHSTRTAPVAPTPAAKAFPVKEAPKPPPVEESEPPRREKDSAPRQKEAPPAPVVPVLGKGAKAKKKRREA
jgi:cytoskeletal protein CcmA (bactofilin family)